MTADGEEVQRPRSWGVESFTFAAILVVFALAIEMGAAAVEKVAAVREKRATAHTATHSNHPRGSERQPVSPDKSRARIDRSERTVPPVSAAVSTPSLPAATAEGPVDTKPIHTASPTQEQNASAHAETATNAPGIEVAQFAGVDKLVGELALHYTFDTNDGQVVADDSGNDVQGAVRDALWTADGHRGGGMKIGWGRAIMVERPLLKPRVRNQSFTFAVWAQVLTRGEFILLLQATPDTKPGRVNIAVFNGSPRVFLGNTPRARNQEIKGPATIKNNEWVHLAAVRNASGTVTLYLNGQVSATGRITGPFLDLPTTFGQYGGSVDKGGSGVIDDVMFWERNLTRSEIQKIYEATVR
jgi:hypothetical protein